MLGATPRLGPPLGALLGALLAAVLTLAGCSSGGGPGRGSGRGSGSAAGPVASIAGAPTTGLRGSSLTEPIQLSPSARTAPFRSSRGGTTTLADLQRGRLLLLFFGYTHCPDECPTAMADLAAALRTLPPMTQSHTQVVFVTSDPQRDSPRVLRTWLANFDHGLLLPFAGLTAPVQQIDTIAESVGVPLSPPVRRKGGTISVEHGTQTLAFIGGKAPVVWTGGTSPTDLAHDIELLISRVTDAP